MILSTVTRSYIKAMPVHLRINDKDTSRNPYINFVTALPGPRHDEALRRLQQLAAMAKPLMQDQGFHVNSLEEYEWNREFAGRCWNNGEVIELVLTSSKGDWMPLQYVLYVFCHELAHIKHMNHIPRLHGALTRHLKELALTKQRQGYYGDGLWSAGRSLANGASVEGRGMGQGQNGLPDHVCGGAFSRARRGGSALKRKRLGGGVGGRGKFKGPSLRSGAQTARNTRGGNRRVKLEVTGGGSRVDGRNDIPTASAKDASYKLDSNSTFRKRTQTKDAREMRAMAAQARFANATIERHIVAREEQEDKKECVGGVEDERAGAKVELRDVNQDDVSVTGDDLCELNPDQEDGEEDDESIPITQAWHESNEERRRRTRQFYDDLDVEERQDGVDEWEMLLNESCGVNDAQGSSSDHDDHRSNGTTNETRRSIEVLTIDDEEGDDVEVAPRSESTQEATTTSAQGSHWTCQVCTLHNQASRSRCEACDTSRGKRTLAS